MRVGCRAARVDDTIRLVSELADFDAGACACCLGTRAPPTERCRLGV